MNGRQARQERKGARKFHQKYYDEIRKHVIAEYSETINKATIMHRVQFAWRCLRGNVYAESEK